MNHCFLDWNLETDLPETNQNKLLGSENELVELLWRNGQVVFNSQKLRKPSLVHNDTRQFQTHDHQSVQQGYNSNGISSSLIQDDETVSWIQDPFDDSLDKEFCSNFLSDPIEDDKHVNKFEPSEATQIVENPQPRNSTNHSITPEDFPMKNMPPPKQDLGKSRKIINFSQFSLPFKGDLGSSNGQNGDKNRECSVMTVGSSYCGSNHVPNDPEASRVSSIRARPANLSSSPSNNNGKEINVPQCERGKIETLEPNLTSSSGGSEDNSHKRKSRDVEESESQSETAELEPVSGKKPPQKSGSSRRSRAAEVHNLSERRRRDRINEKMRVLQELIPHCNKTDKASMLDEAIEYLKSLQLQLKVMWMGSGMAPMMFPGMQHYMSPQMGMGMGIGSASLPSIHNTMHLQRVPPLVDQSMSTTVPNQSMMCQTPVLNPVTYQNQMMQNLAFSDQYSRFMSFQHMQNASQHMNVFRFGPPAAAAAAAAAQQNQTTAAPNTTTASFIGRPATDLQGK